MRKQNGGTFDPRTKLALGMMGIAAVLMTGNARYLVVEFLLLFLGMSLFKLLRPWVRSLKLMLPLVVLVFVVSLLSFSLIPALSLSLRLFNLFTLSFIFFQSMDPQELGDSLRQMGVPYEFSFILTTSLRYVPLITGRMQGIMDAQRSRGIDLRLRLRNVPHFMALFMPLLIQAFVLAEQLAMAMETRGFVAKGRTFRKFYRISILEYGIMVSSLGLLLACGVWGKG